MLQPIFIVVSQHTGFFQAPLTVNGVGGPYIRSLCFLLFIFSFILLFSCIFTTDRVDDGPSREHHNAKYDTNHKSPVLVEFCSVGTRYILPLIQQVIYAVAFVLHEKITTMSATLRIHIFVTLRSCAQWVLSLSFFMEALWA